MKGHGKEGKSSRGNLWCADSVVLKDKTDWNKKEGCEGRV